MNNDTASERAVELVLQALDVLHRADLAPSSPVNEFQPAKIRREIRRLAVRLRKGQALPRYANLFSAQKLATILERTAQRDETCERALEDFKLISQDLDRVFEEGGPAVLERMRTLFFETYRAAQAQGPASEAARRFSQMLLIAVLGHRKASQRRRQKAAPKAPLPFTPDLTVQASYREIAAEFVETASPDESVIAIPPENSGQERVLIHIGLGDASWIGSFECGHNSISTVVMMPDQKHLFVSADGAGYVIERKSHALVERTGMDVVGTVQDEKRTLLIVNHGGISLEAFGTSGRLWKTGPIAFHRFRRLRLRGDELAGDAGRIYRNEWTPFAVKLATGEVRFD